MKEIASPPAAARNDGVTLHGGRALGGRDGLAVVECARCGYAHLREVPDVLKLDEYYASEFWQKTKAGALAQMEAQAGWWTAIYGDWLTVVEQYAPGRTLLDVGAGYGQFVQAAMQRGWNAWAIEPSREAAQHCATRVRPRGVTAGGYHQWHDPLRYRYDGVAALWLIEHLPDPLGFVYWAQARLLPGGVLLAVVPNDFSAAQAQVNRTVAQPYYWIDRTHLNYFNWASFSNVLGRAGFRLVERLTLYPMENFLLVGQDYTCDGARGAELHRAVEAADLEMTRTERLRVYRELAARGEGREIVAVAVNEG